MSDETTPDLTALLAEHRLSRCGRTSRGFNPCRCSCGHQFECPTLRCWEACEVRYEFHVAERVAAAGFGPVRAVEAERDEWQASAFSALDQRDDQRRRAESAEAALAGLREGIEALIRDHADRHWAPRLRAVLALAPTPDREEARDE